jgi:membrane associated rhomboid family serine protease/uncharacterized RDD family membrane protein YckC/Tfp pilus assembly protein PilF
MALKSETDQDFRPGIADSRAFEAESQTTAAVSYEAAGPGKRLVSAILDGGCIFLILVAVEIWELILGISLPIAIVSMAVGTIYYTYYWTKRDGQTPGKRRMGLRVAAINGGPITLGMALSRYIIGYSLNGLTLGTGWLMIVYDAQHQGLHDRLAGTVVVNANARSTSDAESQLSAALRCLDEGHYKEARAILKQLDPGAGSRLEDFVDLLEHLDRQHYETAHALLRTMHALCPEGDPMVAQLDMIQNALWVGRYDDAYAEIHRALRIEIDDRLKEIAQTQTSSRDVSPVTVNDQISATHAFVTPVVTYLLIAVNALIFLLTTGQKPYVWGASYHELIIHGGEYYRLVSAMFLHANLEHVFFNMLALFMTGNMLERYIGHAKFLAIYFAGGLAGSITSAVMNTNMASLGASGAVFAVFGAAFLFSRRYDTLLDEAARKQFRRAGGAILFNFINGIRPGSGIDNLAHLGGLVGGVIVAALVYTRFTLHRREFQVLGGSLIVLTVILGLTAVPVLSARTISDSAITVRIPSGWHVDTDVDSDPNCQNEGMRCLFIFWAPSGLVYEVDTFSGLMSVLSLAQIGDSLAAENKRQGRALVSGTEITVDTREAIQQVYQVDDQHWMFIFAKEQGIVLRLLIVGSPEDLQDYRGEINTFIANVHFRGTPTAENSNEEAEASSGDEFTYLSSGLGHLEAGEYAQAIADFDEAIRLNPNSVVAFMFRGYAYSALGKYDQAITDCDQAIRLDSANTAALICRANVYKAQGNPELAISDMDKIIRIEPRNTYAYFFRGGIYFDQLDYPQAIADWSTAILFEPDYTDAFVSRGSAYCKQGEWTRAIADLNEAIGLDPANADAYYYRGLVYYEQINYAAAISDFDQAILLNPAYADAYFKRGLAHYTSSEKAMALADLKVYVRLAGEDADLTAQSMIAQIEAERDQ